MKKITTFEAKDGEIFRTVEECKDYEKLQLNDKCQERFLKDLEEICKTLSEDSCEDILENIDDVEQLISEYKHEQRSIA